jgi:hypothetical protein
MHVLQGFLMLGGLGLVVGAGVGAASPGWKVLAGLTLLVALGLWVGLTHVPGCADDDDCPSTILAGVAVATNFGGWVAGVGLGTAVARVGRRG